jgi:hydrogenase nickel incorporation protein HypA/HybF
MQDTIDLACNHARACGARRIHRIVLRIGRLAGVEPEALAFAFEAVGADTEAEGAELVIESVPVICDCSTCGRSFECLNSVFLCPDCGTVCGKPRSGMEFELARLEVS